MELGFIAGTISTTIFTVSNIPMLVKAARTRSLRSYSYTHIVMNNAANLIHWLYVLALPFGPIWVLHSFYTISALLMLVWYLRYEKRSSKSLADKRTRRNPFSLPVTRGCRTLNKSRSYDHKNLLLHKLRSRLIAIFAVSLTICVGSSLATLLADNAESAYIDPHEMTDRQVTVSVERTPWFRKPEFVQVMEKHDRFLPELVKWRRLFGQHADELARLLKSFPGSEGLSEAHLRAILVHPEPMVDSLAKRDVFHPWVNRWSGIWSNGVAQYHLWDSTRSIGDRHIQPVTLSETRFVNQCCVEKMVEGQSTDIAINVVSPNHGITGWVSKTQHGQLELPHIGYLVNETTLIWICQMRKPGRLFQANTRWFLFLETVNLSVNPAEYRIYGQMVEIVDGKFAVDAKQRGQHHGVYYAAVRKQTIS